jgi:acyl-CoA synthetase
MALSCEARCDFRNARFRAGVGDEPALVESPTLDAAPDGSPQVSKALADVIGERAVEAPDRAAYLAGGARLSWAEYDALSQQLARLLLGLGLERGERLAVLLPDGPGVHVAYLAAEKAGLVVVGIGARAGFRELEHALRLTRASGLISRAEHQGRSMPELVRDLREQGLSIRQHLVVEDELAEGQPVLVSGSRPGGASASDEIDARLRSRRLAAEDLFLLNFTSGTTGLPKCVKHDQKRWMSFHEFARSAGDLNESDVFMCVVPAPFGFGIWSGHVTPALLGVPTLLMPRFSAGEAICLIERHRPTVLAAVSTQLVMMVNSPALESHDLTSLRVVFTGGEALPYERAAEFEERTGARVLQFYGSNETGAVSRTTLRDSREKRLRTAGRVIDEMNVRLFDESGNDVTASGRGQPGCKGPTLSGGYYDDEAANARLIRDDGWMMLGDIVQIDDEGYLRVIGRKGDFIIRGGKNISGPGVEEEVSRHPAVAVAAAVAMPDEVFGERVCVYAELRPGASLDLEGLAADLERRGVSKEIWPERLIVLPELPRSSGGKLAKQRLREDIARRVASEGGGFRRQGEP